VAAGGPPPAVPEGLVDVEGERMTIEYEHECSSCVEPGPVSESDEAVGARLFRDTPKGVAWCPGCHPEPQSSLAVTRYCGPHEPSVTGAADEEAREQLPGRPYLCTTREESESFRQLCALIHRGRDESQAPAG
jgi:hypothetical protein